MQIAYGSVLVLGVILLLFGRGSMKGPFRKMFVALCITLIVASLGPLLKPVWAPFEIILFAVEIPLIGLVFWYLRAAGRTKAAAGAPN